jgi:mannose-6-phosphate isomerase
VKPIRLTANQPQRFYRGGSAIARFRGNSLDGEHVPEDWVGSTTSIVNSAPFGLSTLPDGQLLRDAVAADAEAFLGTEHLEAFGPDPRLLVKLLDAGQRLPVHVHPNGAFAQEHLGARCGKSEAWLMLAGGTIHLGFGVDIDAETLERWFDAQDAAAMLGALNEVTVSPGDCVYVPAGTPHAIGEGVFMVEAQEPSDLAVLLEWRGFIGVESATMGLDQETALAATRRSAVSREELADWTRRGADAPELRPGARGVVPPEAQPFFRVEWLRPDGTVLLEPSWAILVAIDGKGLLATEDGELELTRGDTVLVPYGAGASELTGAVEAIRCLPPRPGTNA